jgi:DNA replication and repair protein RecF
VAGRVGNEGGAEGVIGPRSVRRIRVLGFRNLAPQELELGDGVTLLWGPNGAGKTNVVEAICMGLAGRSCRTANDREAIGFGEPLARVEVEVRAEGRMTEVLWSLGRGGERRHLVDGNPSVAEHGTGRPALTIFLPDRLGLVKGPPAARRAHLDRLCAALWPVRVEARRRYGRALAQRNALLGRVRAGAVTADSLDAWEGELGAAGVELIAARTEAVEALAEEFSAAAGELGLSAAAELRYRPRSEATEPAQLAAELRARRQTDLARAHTAHGPHLDELVISAGGRSLRHYGSQGEQRSALLALLFAERRALLEARRAPPLMLLDDVMSELDPDRRELLARRLQEGEGQAVLTATEPSHLPASCDRIEVALRRGEAVGPPPADTPPGRDAARVILAA